MPRDLDLHQKIPFHGGQELDGAGALGNLIGEFLVHGRDVAPARGKHWKIGSRNAALAIDAGTAGRARLRSPGRTGRPQAGDPHPGDERLGARPRRRRADQPQGGSGAKPADVRIYARAEPLLLNLYGRFGLARATLHGTAVIGGRRPWRVRPTAATFLTP